SNRFMAAKLSPGNFRLLQQYLPLSDIVQRSKSLLLDHLVGGHLHDQRHREAERLGGPKIDHQFELGWLQGRQVGWLCALENVPSVNARLAIGASNACPIAHQAAGFDVIASIVNRWNGMARRQCNQPLTLASKEWTAADQQRARTRVDYLRERGVEFAFTCGIHH